MSNSQIVGERRHPERAVDPSREVDGGRPVADLDNGYAFTDRYDLADSIGHRYACLRLARTISTTEYEHISVIEADCPYQQDRFAWSRNWIGTFRQAQGTNAVLSTNLVDLHNLLRIRRFS
jgi:hypothetical protein